MELSNEEREWAVAIKEAMIKEDEALAKTISDFEYVHHAIIAKGKPDKAIKRIQRLDKFRKEHDIPIDANKCSADEAMTMIQAFEAKSPGMFLSFGKDSAGSHGYLSTWDYASFLPANYQEATDWKNCFAAFYYVFDAMHPDFDAIRSGIIMLADAEGLGWRNFSLEMEKQAAHLYQDAYPIRIQNITMLHSPTVFKAIYALCKPFLKKKVKDVIHLNGKLEEIRDQIPKNILATTMGGIQTTSDMEDAMKEGLKLRYSNMASFIL